MKRKKGFKQTYFIDDMEIMSLRYNSSSSGIIVAFRNKQGIDFHLTIYHEGLSLFSHVVYKNKETGESSRTPNKEFNLEDFLNHITTELGDDFIYHYDEQIMCYTFTDKYLESILGKNNEQGNQDVDVMNALQYIDSDTDFSNKEQYHYTDIVNYKRFVH